MDNVRTFTDVGVSQVSVGVLVEERGTLLALPAHGVVLAVVAHASANVTGWNVHGEVEVTRQGMAIALASWKKEKRVVIVLKGELLNFLQYIRIDTKHVHYIFLHQIILGSWDFNLVSWSSAWVAKWRCWAGWGLLGNATVPVECDLTIGRLWNKPFSRHQKSWTFCQKTAGWLF